MFQMKEIKGRQLSTPFTRDQMLSISLILKRIKPEYHFGLGLKDEMIRLDMWQDMVLAFNTKLASCYPEYNEEEFLSLCDWEEIEYAKQRE